MFLTTWESCIETMTQCIKDDLSATFYDVTIPESSKENTGVALGLILSSLELTSFPAHAADNKGWTNCHTVFLLVS